MTPRDCLQIKELTKSLEARDKDLKKANEMKSPTKDTGAAAQELARTRAMVEEMEQQMETLLTANKVASDALNKRIEELTKENAELRKAR